MSRIDRNKILVRHIVSSGLATSQKDLGLKLGYSSESAFSQVINEKVDYPKDFIERLQRIIPALNVDWLLTGRGNMLRSQPTIVAEHTSEYSSDVIEVDAEDIKKFSLPFVTNDIAQSPNVDIKALVTANSPKLGRYPIGQKLSGVSYAQRIITEAMTSANFFPGDIIFLTYLDKTQLISDSAYLLDTRDYGTLFRLVTIEKDGLLLRPCSDDKDRFKPIFLREDKILSYAALVMQVRTSFSFSNGIHLAEMVKNRDEQIKRMVDAQQQMLDELCRQNERLDKERERTERERERTDKLVEKIINQ